MKTHSVPLCCEGATSLITLRGLACPDAPRGPAAILTPPEVRTQSALPPEAARIVSDLLVGTISDLEAVGALGRLRTQLAKKVPPFLGP